MDEKTELEVPGTLDSHESLEFETDVTPTGDETSVESKFSPMAALKSIANAVKSGMIDKKQAQQMRSEMGIRLESCTKKKFNKSKTRLANKRAKVARRATRAGTKGQKNTKGARFSR